MHLNSLSACGFRSLALVEDIPISRPTVLAGHNDGGKSAVLTALAFLLDQHVLTDEDRTYLSGAGAADGRCQETWVKGDFSLDSSERASGMPERLQIRRRAVAGGAPCWEYLGSQPADERLRGLDKLLKPALVELVHEYGLTAKGSLKEDLLVTLTDHAANVSQEEGWLALPKPLLARLPRLLSFSGKDESPDDAVRTALGSCYEAHLQDEALQGRVRDIEDDITQRLEKDADSLCAHIRSHCGDLVGVAVKPEVSFRGGFKRAPLHISRADGEPVDLSRSGQGSSRRIALAIWEWTSNILEDAELANDEQSDGEPPTQTIVVYDEPDTHLDYRHQRTVMDIIRRQCNQPHTSVVVATHSMNLIDGVDIADVVHLKLGEDGRTRIERLTDDSHDGIDFHLGQIAAALGLRNSVLLHERCFLAVEGDTELQSVPVLFRLAQGMSLQAAGIALWECENNEGALHLARYLIKHQRTVHLMVDADSRTNKFFTEDRLKRFGIDPATQVSYVGEAMGFNELEELFDDQAWAVTANCHWPRSQTPWEPGDFAAHRGGKFSSAVLNMIKNGAAEKSPNGKPAMLYALAASLRKPEDVPEQLREVFGELQALAH